MTDAKHSRDRLAKWSEVTGSLWPWMSRGTFTAHSEKGRRPGPL
jgi:hypothetical protein